MAAEAAREPGACLRLILEGEVAPGCAIDVEALAGAVRRRPGAARGRRPHAARRTTSGRSPASARCAAGSSRRLLQSDDPAAGEAVLAGLRALDGHAEVLGAH